MSLTDPVTVKSRDGRRAGLVVLCQPYRAYRSIPVTLSNVHSYMRAFKRQCANIQRQKRGEEGRVKGTRIPSPRETWIKFCARFSRARESAILLLLFLTICVIYSRNCNRGKCTDTLKQMSYSASGKQKWHDSNICIYSANYGPPEWRVNSAKIFIELSLPRAQIFNIFSRRRQDVDVLNFEIAVASVWLRFQNVLIVSTSGERWYRRSIVVFFPPFRHYYPNNTLT